MSENYRKESRKDWIAPGAAVPNLEQLKFGAIQRIADATELIAKRHQDLIDERDRYKRWYETECARTKRMAARINALRGVITKLKRKAAEGRS